MIRLILAVAFCAAAAPAIAHAQSELSARRLYLLCQMEDPSCRLMLEKAYADFLANPTAGVGPDYVCKPTGKMTLPQPYTRFMDALAQGFDPIGASARVGVYQAFNMSGMCRGR